MLANAGFVYGSRAVIATALVLGSSSSPGVGSPPTATSAAKDPLRFCLPTAHISPSPFESLQDPTRLFYLFILTKPYLGTAENPGVLSKWQFSPDGLTLRAEVAPDAFWRNGRRVHAREAALGIAKGMLSKPVGAKTKVLGHERLLSEGWERAEISGVRIVSESTFELVFQSEVKNTSGVLREALGLSSRASRMWPVRLDLAADGTSVSVVDDFVSKYPLKMLTRDAADLEVHGRTVRLQAGRCDDGDFYAYAPGPRLSGEYTASAAHAEQALIATFNSARPGLKMRRERERVGAWLRGLVETAHGGGLSTVKGHFIEGEPGYRPGVQWKSSTTPPPVKKLNVLLGTPWPSNAPVRAKLDEQARAQRVKLEWSMSRGDAEETYDVKLAGFRIQKGRALWAQYILDDEFYVSTLPSYPLTAQALSKVRAASAATVPVGKALLEETDDAAMAEWSLVPVGRYAVNVFSRAASPLRLVFTPEDELSFEMRR